MMIKALFPLLLLAGISPALAADSPQESLVKQYSAAAKAEDAAFAGASAERGKAFYLSESTSGKPDTPSCAACHTSDPRKPGKTRAGKQIDAMALSVTPDRFSDPAKVEKWFLRNCDSVLSRACTNAEKADFLAFLISQ